MKIKLNIDMDLDSKFYKNCRSNRGRETMPQCCAACPFRKAIEKAEQR